MRCVTDANRLYSLYNFEKFDRFEPSSEARPETGGPKMRQYSLTIKKEAYNMQHA